MGSFKDDGQGQGRPGRRWGKAGRRRGVLPDFEWLEGRTLLATPQITDLGLDPASDREVPGDQNTNLVRPGFIGRVVDPTGPVAGLPVAISIDGIPAITVATDAQGLFRFQPPFALGDGLHRLMATVAGATSADRSFRVDTTRPRVVGSSLPEGARIQALAGLSLNVEDPVAATAPALPVPLQLSFSALQPATANNISNYTLLNLGADRAVGTSDDRDLSTFINSATFVSTTNRLQTIDPYTGRIDLTFAMGLPAGLYRLVAHTTEPGFAGITDAAGNPLALSFGLTFELQPQPAFITSFLAIDQVNGLTGPRAFYEIPAAGVPARATPPPRTFFIEFSNPLASRADNYAGAVQLFRSANSMPGDPLVPSGPSDGDFGPGGLSPLDPLNSTRVPVMVNLEDSISGATIGQPGFRNRLRVQVPGGVDLPADHYRLYIPNAGPQAIFDLFGNQVDGEFLGNPTPTGGNGGLQPNGTFRAGALTFENFLPDGTFRAGLTGDGVAGGAFTTGFTVVPTGNVLFAQPDYFDDPFLTSDDPDGSLARPFAALAPEADPLNTVLHGGNLNDPRNFGTGFNPAFDRNGNGRFDRSVIFAAVGPLDPDDPNDPSDPFDLRPRNSLGPVVIVALPARTGQTPFVLQAPRGSDLVRNDASISVPFNTTLAFAPSSTVKLQNASIFVQNQGTAIQTYGGPNARVTFTSFADDSIGGDTNGNLSDTRPIGGDWGGIVLRNFNDATPRPFPQTVRFPIEPNGRLRGGPGSGADVTRAVSGADDVRSSIDFATLRFGGGPVPQSLGPRYDSIMLFNSRPAITNVVVSDAFDPNAVTATQAAISADFDSFREDDIARGPLIRRTILINSSINGLLIRAEEGTVEAQQTDAIAYGNNPTTLGGSRNFVFDDPLAHVLLARLNLGQELQQGSGGELTTRVSSRLYVQPGMLVKSRSGASILVSSTTASINIGDRTYIRQFDVNANASPLDLGFRPNTPGDARPIFTTLLDDTATTSFLDPTTSTRRTIVPANDTNNDGPVTQPVSGAVPFTSRWGALQIVSGAVTVIDEAEFRFGGGSVLTPSGTIPSRTALTLFGAGAAGTRASITNNDFFDNFDAPISIEPNGLLAADPLRPLLSGNPFFRGNVFQRNDVNGLAVQSNIGAFGGPTGTAPIETPLGSFSGGNLTVDSVWDDTDLTYVVRGSIVLGGFSEFNLPVPSLTPPPGETGFPELRPAVVLTIQSSLPDTLLADGTRIARPGETVLVKLLNDYLPAQRLPDPVPAIDPNLQNPGADTQQAVNVGAGFVVGWDDGSQPTANSPLIDPGAYSQLRIVGIGSNETTGQQRVPAIITSLRDTSVGRMVRGVAHFDIFTNDPRGRFTGAELRTPARGDGGDIGFGGNSLTDYNLYDPRNGNLIDNADLRFLHRVEIQGGGIVDAADVNNDNAITITDNWRQQKRGTNALTQFNSSKAMTISNSNLSDFREAGVFVHPGFDAIVRRLAPPPPGAPPGAGIAQISVARVGSLKGFGVDTFFVNNTFTNLPVGIRINVERTGDADQGQSPEQAVFLHNTFNNNGTDVHTDGINGNPISRVNFIAMNNIFTNSAGVGFIGEGNLTGQLQFNLFSDPNINDVQGVVNFNPQFGDPRFRDPANRNFNLLPGSAAIDAAISEFDTVPGDILIPISNQRLDATGGVRNFAGRQGGSGIVTLPGYRFRTFVDQFIPVLPGTPGSAAGPASIPGSYNYLPLPNNGGERDQLGFLRQDDRLTRNVGFGSREFFDIGAFEFREFFPPHVISAGAGGVIATIPDPTVPGGLRAIDIYRIGGVAATNLPPQTIQILFDERLDPNTILGGRMIMGRVEGTVLLQASGGDGIFGNANSALDRSIDLSGKLDFNLSTRTLTINLVGTNLPDDFYRIILRGTGDQVIRDPEGNALDGENLDAAGLQRALPSGDGFPGGDFVLTFTVDASPPSFVAGTFQLAPASDSNRRDNITRVALPSFIGTIADVLPPTSPLQGQTVILDILTPGPDRTPVRANAGTATTDAAGNFTVTVTGAPLPDGVYRALARVVGLATTAEVLFTVDTRGPQVLDVTPARGSLAPAPGGRVTIAVTFDENIDPSRLLVDPNRPPAEQTLLVVRAGGDGIFDNGNDVAVPIDPDSITPRPGAPGGTSLISFTTQGGALANDVYRVTLVGAGPTPIIDIAGNPLAGGTNFDFTFFVFDPTLSRRIFVDDDASLFGDGSRGSRANPFRTITEGLAAAQTGDIVAVLPGVYTEAGTIQLKSLVRLVSATLDSDESLVLPGDALRTVIRASFSLAGPVVLADGLMSVDRNSTQFSGFTVDARPVGRFGVGSIDPSSIGILVRNSDLLIDNNYIIDAGFGIVVEPGALRPRIENNGLIGNIFGLRINGAASSASPPAPVRFANNTLAFNTIGVIAEAGPGGTLLGDLVNNIFEGPAISAPPGILQARFNLFSNNGGPIPEGPGNIVGNPAFVAARDPRNAPANFFLEADFSLGLNSAAIDMALEQEAPPLDFTSRERRFIVPGRGGLGRGPADIGAFEYRGSGAVLLPSGQSLAPSTAAPAPASQEPAAQQAPVSQSRPETRAERRRRLLRERRERAAAVRQQRREQQRLKAAQRLAQQKQRAAQRLAQQQQRAAQRLAQQQQRAEAKLAGNDAQPRRFRFR